MMLLSKPESNFKISKNLKENYNTYSLNHAHSDISGFNVCAMANRLSKNENNPKKIMRISNKILRICSKT